MTTLPELKQYVTSEICLACDGCCRFKEEDSRWRPKVAASEKDAIKRSDLATEILRREIFTPQGYILAQKADSSSCFTCVFLHRSEGTCRIYARRPFDCRLYPFVLDRKEEKIRVCVHRNCPFIEQTLQSPPYEEYVQYLKNYFSHPQVKDFLRANPELAGDFSMYADELEPVFALEL